MKMARESVSKCLPNLTAVVFGFHATAHESATSLLGESRFRLFCKKSKPESVVPILSDRQETHRSVFPNLVAVFSLRHKVYSPYVRGRLACAQQFVPTIHV